MIMKLAIAGHSISRISFDYAFSLSTADGAELRIETAFEFIVGDERPALVEPSCAVEQSRALVRLLHREIEASHITETGELLLRIEGGTTIRVSPHDEFEAWTFAGANGEKAVCMPGGVLATWV